MGDVAMHEQAIGIDDDGRAISRDPSGAGEGDPKDPSQIEDALSPKRRGDDRLAQQRRPDHWSRVRLRSSTAKSTF